MTTLSALIVVSPKMVLSPLDTGDVTMKPIKAFKRIKRIHREIPPRFDRNLIIKFINRQEMPLLVGFFLLRAKVSKLFF